ncbi:MAG: hypothetical protein ACK56F_03080, partial [bacterium]
DPLSSSVTANGLRVPTTFSKISNELPLSLSPPINSKLIRMILYYFHWDLERPLSSHIHRTCQTMLFFPLFDLNYKW